MVTLLTILHIFVCLFLMLTVLLQSGKGGGMGALGGGGGTTTVFGGSGASTFLRSLTAVAATVFMLASMTLAFIASHNAGDPLDKFGASQDDIRAQKDKEKDRALAPGALGSAFTPKAGSAPEAPISVPQGATMGVPDKASDGSDAARPTTGTTPILGSGFEPGPATAPVPTGAGAATVAPPRSGSTTSPTTTSVPATSVPATSVPAPRADAPRTETPKAVTPATKTDVPKSDSPSPSPGAVTPTPAAPAGSAQ
jgi:preprotein translocase subunit SecG